MSAHGFDVFLAATADEAVAIFEKYPRAVVLLDMKLNGTSGLDVLRQLKQRNPQAVIVQMSGYPELQPDMEQGLTINARSYFTKPLDIDDVIDTLRRVMREPKKPV